jgi:hypothetical protein
MRPLTIYLTRVKMLRLMHYWWKQDWTMLCCPHCSQLSTILNNIVTPDSGSTVLFNIVDKCEQRGQQNIVQSCWATGSAFFAVYTSKNAQVDAILMKTGLNKVLLPTLFIAVNNIEQCCYTRFRLNNIVQYCWILLTSVNNVGSKTLFNPVEQRAQRFLPCMSWHWHFGNMLVEEVISLTSEWQNITRQRFY